MRISDWSSDVCSSDLGKDQGTGQYLNSVPPLKAILGLGCERDRWGVDAMLTAATRRNKVEYPDATADAPNPDFRAPGSGVVDLMAYWKTRSEARRVGKERCSKCRCRGLSSHSKDNLLTSAT